MPLLNRPQGFPDYTAPAGSVTVNIDVSGALTLTGQAIGLTLSVAPTAGALTLTGQTIGLTLSVNVVAGAITVTGQDLPLIVDVPHSPVTFPKLARLSPMSVRGPPVLVHQGFPSYVAQVSGTTTNVDTPGALTFTGQGVGLTVSVAVAAGAITLTGQSPGLTDAVTPAAGAVTFTGQTVGLTTSVAPTAGAVTFNGQALGLKVSIAVTPGAITFTGQDLPLGLDVPHVPATFPRITGLRKVGQGPPVLVRQTTPNFNAPGQVAVTVQGQITFTGQTVGLVQSQAITAGALTFAGQTVGFAVTAVVTAGAVTFSGQTIVLVVTGISTTPPIKKVGLWKPMLHNTGLAKIPRKRVLWDRVITKTGRVETLRRKGTWEPQDKGQGSVP